MRDEIKHNTLYEFVDMVPFIQVNNLKQVYYAGGQLEILEDAFEVEWIVCEMEDDYQGEWWAVFKMVNRIHVMNGYFGSCSGCDDLEDEVPMEWLRDHVKNVRAFNFVEDAIRWLRETDDYSWRDIKDQVVRALENV